MTMPGDLKQKFGFAASGFVAGVAVATLVFGEILAPRETPRAGGVSTAAIEAQGITSRLQREPEQNVLELPRASTDFAGRWHGRLKLGVLNGSAEYASEIPQEVSAGAYFVHHEERMAAKMEIWGPPDLEVVQSSGEVVGPDHVRLTVELLVKRARGRALWRVEQSDMILNRKTIRCRRTDRYLKEPGADAFATATYDGILQPISDAEGSALTELWREEGWQFRGGASAHSSGD
jgi:hypothetical protein